MGKKEKRSFVWRCRRKYAKLDCVIVTSLKMYDHHFVNLFPSFLFINSFLFCLAANIKAMKKMSAHLGLHNLVADTKYLLPKLFTSASSSKSPCFNGLLLLIPPLQRNRNSCLYAIPYWLGALLIDAKTVGSRNFLMPTILCLIMSW